MLRRGCNRRREAAGRDAQQEFPFAEGKTSDLAEEAADEAARDVRRARHGADADAASRAWMVWANASAGYQILATSQKVAPVPAP